MKRPGLSGWIFIGFAAGLILGAVFGREVVFLQPIGDLFLRLMQMIVLPLVIVTILHGVSHLGEVSKLRRIGGKVLLFFVVTTVLSAATGVILANLFKPGVGVKLAAVDPSAIHKVSTPSLVDTLLGMAPANPFVALVEGNLIQVIFFCILLGIAITMAGETAAGVKKILSAANEIIFRLVDFVLWSAPFGIASLCAVTVGVNGWSVFGPMGKLILIDYLGAAIILFVLHGSIIRFYLRVRLKVFFRKILQVWAVTAGTASSNAALPVSMQTTRQDFNVPDDIVGFTLPLGATMNMNGAANYFALVVVFASQVYGIEMTIAEQFTTVLLASLISIGAPGVGGGGIVLTLLLLKTMDLPLDIIGMIAAIYRIIDTAHTTANVTGDIVAAMVVAKSEKVWSHHDLA